MDDGFTRNNFSAGDGVIQCQDPPPMFDSNYWLNNQRGQLIELCCLMPNGLYIPLEVNRNATLQEIKDELFEEASKYPMHWALQDRSTYVFLAINQVSERESIFDESKRLLDVNPFFSTLRLEERKSEKPDEQIQNTIRKLIGKGKANFQELKSSEVTDFRWRIKNFVEDIVRERDERPWQGKMMYQYPPSLAPSSNLPSNVRARLTDGNFFVNVKFEDSETCSTKSSTVQVRLDSTPQQLLAQILNKKAKKSNTVCEQPRDFVLKVCGRLEYLLGERAIVNFCYIQDTLARDVVPTLIAVPIASIPVEMESVHTRLGNLDLSSARPTSTSTLTKRKGKYMSSWELEINFFLRICSVSKLNCDSSSQEKQVQAAVAVGLFHGAKSLCEPQKTSERQVAGNGECVWEEDLKFDLLVSNIPRMARLCIVVYEVTKNPSKGTKPRKMKDPKDQDKFLNPIAWVNTTVFDFKNQLQCGGVTLYMWTYSEDMQSENDMLHPLGTVVSNPNVQDSTSLSIAFHKYEPNHQLLYPSLDIILSEAIPKQDGAEVALMNQGALLEVFLTLRTILEQDPFHELHEQERKVIWGMRHTCMDDYPNMLPKVLECVEWNDHKEVANAISLLQMWPKLPAEKALELLDYAYADQTVRSFAVHCLEDVSDEDLSLYLLQLVQAIKHESYLYCDLVEFLLRRALNNRKIGHYLFWHLRSEMNVPSVSVRFGLILEAYCHGSVQHLPVLVRQVECLNKLQFLNEQVRLKPNKEKQRAALHEMLGESFAIEAFKNIISPLDPSYQCKGLKIEKCRVMDSKMKPLWIVFDNADPHGDDIYIIYKNGDDLRQDMLTLQMIRIMDRLWKLEGLDFRMNPYNCISTEHRVGLIEVVLNAETIANIQKEKGMFSATSAFRKGSLLAWLKDHNTSEAQLNKAIEEFTLSCAGYCVATYVLGIADRHSDNIMVKRSGQLFHIDFGHILGHFKEKFGFRRERAPFVLTHDFVHVINKGQAKEKAPEFKTFQDLCEKAFIKLRQHGCLILSLFAMMISTGLPELSSEKDLNYLQDTLVLNKTEEEALNHFRSKFDEALSNSWKTSLNWASHNVSKNNKQ